MDEALLGLGLFGGSSAGPACDPVSWQCREAVVDTIAGTGVGGSADGVGRLASFNTPRGLATDGTDLFIADAINHTIRRMNLATGSVTTLAGAVFNPGNTDGVGTGATFAQPTGLALLDGNLYVTCAAGWTVRRVVVATATVTTVAGSGLVGTHPSGIAVHGGYLYVADRNGHTIRRITIATGAVITFAGAPGFAGWLDGAGTAARFNRPVGLTTDGTYLYVSQSHSVRRIELATRQVTTLAGSTVGGHADGIGSTARFGFPSGLALVGNDLFVVGFGLVSGVLRRVDLDTGAVTSAAGRAGSFPSVDGVGNEAQFAGPFGLATDGSRLYVSEPNADLIRRVTFRTRAN